MLSAPAHLCPCSPDQQRTLQGRHAAPTRGGLSVSGSGEPQWGTSSHTFLSHRQLSGVSGRMQSRRTSSRQPAGRCQVSCSAEPKWKQKLAAADAHAEATRQLTAQAQEEYKKKQAALRQQAAGGSQAVPLSELPLIPFLTPEGKFTDCSQADAKATVYAILDEDEAVQYIGISRQVNPSMRLHFARMPRQCAFIRLQHITRPSRALLEAVREEWMRESGGPPPGNDNGTLQQRWENPLDCKPLMTEAEREAVETAAPGPPKAKALKQVARRVEAELEAGFRARHCTETLRFDPKLKEQGLLDLKNAAPGPDTSVPSAKPEATNGKTAAATAAPRGAAV